VRVESKIVKVQDLQEWTRRIGQPRRLPRMTRGSRAAGDDSLGDGHWWAAICQQSSGIIRPGDAETGP
jgi:hypothetical protein